MALYWLGGLLSAVALVLFILGLKARTAIAGKLRAGGKQVMRMRGKWLRSPFAVGLTPLALVYRVTAKSGDELAKTRLYAYDPGAWFSRHAAHVRQFSGGVWRDA